MMIVCFFVVFSFHAARIWFAKHGGDSSPSIPLSPSRIREDSASGDAGISGPDLPCFCESASGGNQIRPAPTSAGRNARPNKNP